MSRRSFAALLAAPLVVAAPARAQNGGSFQVLFGTPPGSALVSTVTIPVSVNGELAVSFHGDPGTGCGAGGLCRYGGTVIVRPASGELAIAKLRHGRRITYQADLSLGLGQTQTLAHVQRVGGAGLCADAQQPNADLPVDVRGGRVTLSLLRPGGALLSTRCAGPLDGDLAGTVPRVTVPLHSLLAGGQSLRLTGAGQFAARGFAGTVSSTIVLRLGRPQAQSGSSSLSFPPGIKTERVRAVTEQLTGVAASGSLTADVTAASGGGQCEFLDSCGLSGTVTLSPGFTGLSGALSAMGPAKRPYRDFLAALGVRRGGNPRGIVVLGDAGWNSGGTATADLSQSGGCADSSALGEGYITFTGRGSSVAADYSPAGPARTRCPGPMFPSSQPLASGKVATTALGRTTFTVALAAAGALQDDGYSGAWHGTLSVTLRRGRITQHVSTQPAGF